MVEPLADAPPHLAVILARTAATLDVLASTLQEPEARLLVAVVVDLALREAAGHVPVLVAAS